MPTEQELFTIDYPAREVEDVWQALQRALATMDMRDAATPRTRRTRRASAPASR